MKACKKIISASELKSRAALVKFVNKRVCGAANGLFSDEYWLGHGLVLDAVKDVDGLTVTFNGSAYKNCNKTSDMDDTKTWSYTVSNGRHEAVLVVNAHGAGTVSDPLSKYDITAYCS